MKQNKKNFRYRVNSSAVIIGAIIITLLLNAILVTLNDKISLEIDFTKDKIFQLTEESEELVDKIDKDTEILILTTGTESESLSLVKNVLSKYTQRNGKISVKEVDVAKNPMEVKAYQQDMQNLTLNSLIIRQGDKYETVNSSDFVSKDGGYSYIERAVTGKLANFVDGMTISEIFFTTGHGEQTVDGTRGVLELENYKLTQFDTLTGEFPQNEHSLVIISAPQQDFSAEEIDKLDKYLDKGGNIQIYFDPLYSGKLERLEKYLAEDWGITRKNNIVIDMSNQMESSEYMLAELGSHEITEPLSKSQKRVGYAPANSFDIAIDLPTGVEVKPLLNSSANSYAKADVKSAVSSGFVKTDGDETGVFNLMLAATRTGGSMEVGATGKLIVSGSVETFNALAKDTRFANEDLLLNTISWMKGSESAITVRAKELPGGQMMLSKTQFWTWFVLLIIVVPVALLICGLVVWLRRRYK